MKTLQKIRNGALDIEEYIQLPSFGQSPSHPVMYNPELEDDMLETISKSNVVLG